MAQLRLGLASGQSVVARLQPECEQMARASLCWAVMLNILQASCCTRLFRDHILQALLGMGMGMGMIVTAHLCVSACQVPENLCIIIILCFYPLLYHIMIHYIILYYITLYYILFLYYTILHYRGPGARAHLQHRRRRHLERREEGA